MAQSFMLIDPSNAVSAKVVVLAGSVVKSAWGDNATVWTVPDGKRLTLKTLNVLVNTETARTFKFTNPASTEDRERTYVLGAGSIIMSTAVMAPANVIATGFLEDDV